MTHSDIFESQKYFSVIPIHEFSQDTLNLLSEIYASTRMSELEQTDWTDEQKKVFTDHQFYAQHDYYQKIYPDAFSNAIMQNGKMIGRLYLHLQHPDDVRIIDIALLPEYRNQAIGTNILKDLQQYCVRLNKTLSIHVEQFNPAKKLYERLGFTYAETYDQVYILMKWTPENLT